MTAEENKRLLTCKYSLLPGECNAQQEMPLWLLAGRIIEIATLHANAWGVGYATLGKTHQAWVLSRMAIEMKRNPKVGENYVMSTWIEAYNRHFSERDIEITDESGQIFGYARTIWAVIDTRTRESVDISALDCMKGNVLDKDCPIAKPARIRNVGYLRKSTYAFQYSDTDFNRHVNSLRYICILLNQWDTAFFDTHRISRFEISYLKECYAGKSVRIGVDDTNPLDCLLEISEEDTAFCKARICFEAKE